MDLIIKTFFVALTTLCFSLSTAFAGMSERSSHRYVVSLKSEKKFLTIKNVERNSSGFLGSTARVEKLLEHIHMAVIETADPGQIEYLRRHADVKFVEEEIGFPAPAPIADSAVVTIGSVVEFPISAPWGIKAIGAPGAWLVSRGTGARVLIIDGGIDANHPDLRARLEKGKSFLTGIDYFFDDNGHGTHVAGVVAADGGAEGTGLWGVAPEAHLLIGKACHRGQCNTISVGEAIDWGIGEKVDVINLSIGGDQYSKVEAEAIARAELAGVTVVASAGNGGVSHVSFPADIATVLAVGSVDSQNEKASSSQWGPELDVVAPGVDVYSTVPMGTGRRATVIVNSRTESHELPTLWVGNSVEPQGLVGGELIYVGYGKKEEVRDQDLSGKMILMKRGEMPYNEKVSSVTNQNIKGVVIFNNEPGIFSLKMTHPVGVPVFNIEEARGLELVSLLNKKLPVYLSLGVVPSMYEVRRGTSMACPHVTGIAALLKSYKKNLNPAMVRELIKSTSSPLSPNSHNEFGAGLVNAEAALLKAQQL
jgi:serine protease